MKKNFLDYILKNKKLWIILLINIILLVFVYNDSFIYKKTLLKITKETTSYSYEDNNTSGYKEKYYKQKLKGKILNNDKKGKTVEMKNSFGSSLVYGEKYKKGDIVFIEKIHTSSGSDTLKGNIAGKKRDFYIMLFFLIMLNLLIFVGKKVGILTIASLFFNLSVFIFILYMHNKGYPLLPLLIPGILTVSTVILILISGLNIKTFSSLISTLLTTSIIGVICFLLIKYTSSIDYEFMEYIKEPYTRHDADMIFMGQLLIVGLGAIMDVAITITATASELIRRNPEISTKNLIHSCKEVSDDITGTMINIIFFTNLAAGLSFFVLSMRNGISLKSILHYHVFFELSRFFIGGIGILLCIPVTIAISILMFKKRKGAVC